MKAARHKMNDFATITKMHREMLSMYRDTFYPTNYATVSEEVAHLDTIVQQKIREIDPDERDYVNYYTAIEITEACDVCLKVIRENQSLRRTIDETIDISKRQRTLYARIIIALCVAVASLSCLSLFLVSPSQEKVKGDDSADDDSFTYPLMEYRQPSPMSESGTEEERGVFSTLSLILGLFGHMFAVVAIERRNP